MKRARKKDKKTKEPKNKQICNAEKKANKKNEPATCTIQKFKSFKRVSKSSYFSVNAKSLQTLQILK